MLCDICGTVQVIECETDDASVSDATLEATGKGTFGGTFGIDATDLSDDEDDDLFSSSSSVR